MPKQTRPAQQTVAQRVNARSAELMQEFYQHYDEFVAAHPTMTDEFVIFQGWIIQKVAGLQLALLDLQERLAAPRPPKGK